jgi:hypothetical protein
MIALGTFLIALHERNFTMTELARLTAAGAVPLGYSDAFKIQAERRAELRRMRIIATLAARSDGGDLSCDAPRATELDLGTVSRRLRRSRHGRRLR